MFFLFLLLLSTIAIAGSAAYFSVYGLAATFSGVFWSVVIMGASLEAGKLVAASYLYRYWNQTNRLLKYYLVGGIAALMVLTSGGIFGYLSSGYQADVLPLKQRAEQIKLLDEERERSLTRKRQIDEQISKGPVVSNVQGRDGQIDSRAARTLREATRSRESMNRQFKAEQDQLQKRIAQLDAELLQLRTEQIKTEAHIGPITYIAKVFGVDTDDATKWLVLLIIFAFDPMAVALTLAVNNVLRIRREEEEAMKARPKEVEPPVVPEIPPVIESEVEAVKPEPPKIEPAPVDPEPPPAPVVEQKKITPAPRRHVRPYPGKFDAATTTSAKLEEIISYYKHLREKEKLGQTLTNDEMWDLGSIKKFLEKKGLHIYLD